jgi:hypothetical protein
MKSAMSLEPVLDFFAGDPFAAARGRIVDRLTVDKVTLRALRRATNRGHAEATLTYAWALGALTGREAEVSPVAAADIYLDAVDLFPDDAAAHVGCGLAHAGHFGGRRAVPPAARRSLTIAARLDAGNGLAHVLLAAAHASTGDMHAAERDVEAALAAGAWRAYLSPLGEPLLASAPWLGQNLALLWPDRVDAAVRYVVEILVRRRRPRPLLGLALAIADGTPPRLGQALRAIGAAQLALRVWPEDTPQLTGDTRARLGALAARLIEEQRSLAKRFEDAADAQLRAAGAGVGSGLAATGVGLGRSGRRWPPPIPLLAVTGRQMMGAGLILSAASAAMALMDTRAGRARRRAVERALAADEAASAAQAAGELHSLLDPWRA